MGKKVLVVDDSSTMRRILVNTLKKLGFEEVLEAENGKIGWETVQGSPDFDLILTDWNMPEMDGLGFVKAVKGNDASKAIPMIMITTEAAKDDIMEAVKAGIAGYVVKPFTPDTLKEKIDTVLK